MTNVVPIGIVPRRPTPLADAMRSLAFEFKLRSGQEATHIMLPRRALKSEVKPFIEALVREEPEASDAPPDKKAAHVFDLIVNEGAECEFADLHIVMYDGEQLVVGRADGL